MNIIEIKGQSCLKTREIWEEVFFEDSKKFTDYYFQEKASDNIGYIIDHDIKSMMFRTPYEAVVHGKRRKLSYIVGVATRKQFRHKGMMTALLTRAFKDMYEEREPFTFLMPANPAIYEPFDFAYVYSREIWTLKRESDYTYLESLWHQNELVAAGFTGGFRKAKKEREESDYFLSNQLKSVRNIVLENENTDIFSRIADFSNTILENEHEIYLYRDERYYKRQWKELIAQNGDIFIAINGNDIEGIFLYAREGEVSIQEVVERREGTFPFLKKKEEKKDIIMARIVHLEEMFRLLRSSKNMSFTIKVKDSIIKENEGVYNVQLTPEGGTVTSLPDRHPSEQCVTIKELAPMLLKNVFINEIV